MSPRTNLYNQNYSSMRTQLLFHLHNHSAPITYSTIPHHHAAAPGRHPTRMPYQPRLSKTPISKAQCAVRRKPSPTSFVIFSSSPHRHCPDPVHPSLLPPRPIRQSAPFIRSTDQLTSPCPTKQHCEARNCTQILAPQGSTQHTCVAAGI